MPIYEYLCGKCNRKSEVITFRASEEVPVVCRYCGSKAIRRVPSRVRVRMSEETRMERLADPSRMAGLDENDPSSVARWMKSMGEEMGEDIDVDAMMDEAMEEGAFEKEGAPGPDTAAGLDED